MSLNTSQKVLIVEDDEAIRNLYQLKLAQAGYSVSTAVDGQEGLRKAKELAPQLILLDLRMPLMTGDEMLQKLRETEWGAAIRVIILTNISKNEAPQSLRFLHVDRYVTKVHHTPAQIAEMVGEILR